MILELMAALAAITLAMVALAVAFMAWDAHQDWKRRKDDAR